MRIPLSSPEITEQDIQAVTAVLRTSRLSLGPRLEDFEQTLARYVGATHAVAVNSGTSGLHLCIRALGIGAGDEVILPSFTFIAAANVLLYERAVPVFVDIEPKSLNLDPDKIAAAITPRTRAILVVHTFGVPAAMDEILRIARKHRLLVIEDACEALGAEIRGAKAGSLGDAGVFAFYPNKQVTTGEGGALVTQNRDLARTARMLRNQGRAASGDWFEHAEVGYNYRIPEVNCALGTEQLKRIEAILARREAVAHLYHDGLHAIPDLTLPPMTLPEGRISWFVYVVRLGARWNQGRRDWIWREMTARGIGCGRYFGPIHLQPAYRRETFRKHPLPVTEKMAERTLALPFFNQITGEQVHEVCEVLKELLAVP